jgi:hypothetical protein
LMDYETFEDVTADLRRFIDDCGRRPTAMRLMRRETPWRVVSKCVIFERWGEIKGVGAEFLIAVAAPFREAREGELAPEKYAYLTTQKLERQLKCVSEVLRYRVLRCRNAIKRRAEKAGDHELPIDAVIESSQWYGYRLNPDRVRLIASQR